MSIALLPAVDPAVSALLIGICGTALLIASITDLRTREVPDMLNYGIMFFGLFINASLSALFWDPGFILGSILGLALCFAIGWAMFYAGQWGGGDSKMLMGLGAVLGLPFQFGSSFLFALLLNVLLAGAVYGLFWSIFLVFRNRKKFSLEFLRLTNGRYHPTARLIIVALLIAFAAVMLLPFRNSLFKMYTLWLLILGPLMYYAWLLVKAIERSAMLVRMPVKKVTEGDWIAKDVIIKGKRICGPKDLGISRQQINLLRKFAQRGLIAKVLVKQGIPFIPSFLLALVFTLLWGNPLGIVVGLL